jgi:hypothetical protein
VRPPGIEPGTSPPKAIGDNLMLPFKQTDQLAENLNQKLLLLSINKPAKQFDFVERTLKKIKPLNF